MDVSHAAALPVIFRPDAPIRCAGATGHVPLLQVQPVQAAAGGEREKEDHGEGAATSQP